MSLGRFLLSLVLCFSNPIFAKRADIVEVETNDRLMKVVYLTLGRSTVLSFDDKPVKVVLGNSNYFNAEFVGNDLTIQPLSNVETNLFVYTQRQSKYGFILKVGSSNLYSDIVYVRWKSQSSPTVLEKKSGVSSVGKKILKINLALRGVEVALTKLQTLGREKTYLFDFEVKNITKNQIKLSSFDLYLKQKDKRFLEQKLVLEKDLLKSNEKVRARIIAKLDSDLSTSLSFVHQKKVLQKVISKEYL